MMAIGKIIWQMDKEHLKEKMAIPTLEIGKMIKNTVPELKYFLTTVSIKAFLRTEKDIVIIFYLLI